MLCPKSSFEGQIAFTARRLGIMTFASLYTDHVSGSHGDSTPFTSPAASLSASSPVEGGASTSSTALSSFSVSSDQEQVHEKSEASTATSTFIRIPDLFTSLMAQKPTINPHYETVKYSTISKLAK